MWTAGLCQERKLCGGNLVPIRHLPISDNAPYLHPPPPNVLHNLCFSFLFGITALPREIENNACTNFWGANNVHYGRYISGVFGHFLICEWVKPQLSCWNSGHFSPVVFAERCCKFVKGRGREVINSFICFKVVVLFLTLSKAEWRVPVPSYATVNNVAIS